MKTNGFIKRILCRIIAFIMMFDVAFSASATVLETGNKESIDNDTVTEDIGVIDSDTVVGEINDDIEIEYVDKVYTDDIDADDGILEGQVAAFPEDTGVSTFAIDNDMITENEMIIDLKGADNSNSDFNKLFDNADLYVAYDDDKRDDNPKTDYFIMQGGCTDGEYNYFAFIMKERVAEKDENDKTYYVTTTMDTRIVCYKIDETENIEKLKITTNLMDKLQHINDMTYNSITGEIVIACCQGGYYQKIYTIDATELRPDLMSETQKQIKYFEENSGINFTLHNVSCMVTSIGFNETRNQYVVGLSKQMNSFAILDSDFNLIKTEGYINNPDTDTNWSGQGLHCDNKYIYLTQFDKVEDAEGEKRKQIEPKESRIKIFDWNGNYKKTIIFNIDKKSNEGDDLDPRYHEVENMYVIGDRVLLGFNCSHTAFDRTFNYIDITNYTYYVQYCPDENVENYYEKTGEDYFAKDNNNVKAVMIKGLKTNLYRSRIAVAGKKFTGWTAYRANVNQWLYKKAGAIDSSTNIWCFEGQQPEGYIKYVYRDTQEVAHTGLGGELVLMCARWEDATEFTVRFFSNGGTGTMDNLNVVYGVSTPLSANTFTKDDLDFKWWNAYWPEKNMWYYCSIADINDRGWFIEGCEPEGYIKYKYKDKQSVAQTVYAGSNVYMYAVWNEFTVYYNANGVEVEAEGIIDSKIAEYGGTNTLYSYSTENLYKVTKNGEIIDEPYKGYELECYYQYWVEEDKWRCIDKDGNGKWYSMDTIKSDGYTMYERDPSSYISETVREGEHLVLYAVWSKS